MKVEAVLEQHGEATHSRAADRRSLRLAVQSHSAAAGERRVVIHNISRTGLLIEAPERTLATGDVLVIEVPEDGMVESEVAWESGRFIGCRFRTTISQAAVSGALLRAEPKAADSDTAVPRDSAASSRGEGLAPEVNFQAALLMALMLWAVIAAVAYVVVR